MRLGLRLLYHKDLLCIYVSGPFLTTVKDSQVVNWIELLQSSGLQTKLFVITPIKYILKYNQLRYNKIIEAKKKLGENVFEIFTLRMGDNSFITSFLIMTQIYFRLNLNKQPKVILQTRMANMHKVLVWLKRLYPRLRIVFDYRGAGAEEYINKLGFQTIADVKDVNSFNRYYALLQEERITISHADVVLCVSNRLKDYAKQLMEVENDLKFYVLPGAADQTHFYFDEALRASTRNEFRLNDKKVIIYSGKLIGFWHKKEEIFSLMASLIAIDDSIFFLCITPDDKAAEELIKKNHLPGKNIKVFYSSYMDINKYLCAADYALILRDNIMTNNVASPTKIAEYLLAGLPVVTNPGIGDYSAFISSNNLGVVSYYRTNNEVLELQLLIRSHSFDRYRISEVSGSRYSKQQFIDELITIYEQITI